MTRIIFAIVLLCITQISFAKIHSISYNEKTVISLQNGDEIALKNFPTGWFYSRIILGINSIPSVPLSGNLTVNDCRYNLRSYYHEINFKKSDSLLIQYEGPSQNLPIQWWVDSEIATSTCQETNSKTDSIKKQLIEKFDSIYFEQIKNDIDLGELNSTTEFKGISSNFKITELPKFEYTTIYVQIEPTDKKQLNGYFYAGNKRVPLSGWNTIVKLSHQINIAPTFEIVMNDHRKIKLKWWAKKETPEWIEIKKTEKLLDKDFVEAIYEFDETPFVSKNLSLKFDKRKFVDGKIPTYNKLEFNPNGPENYEELCILGDIYDIDAKLKNGDTVDVALPLDFSYSTNDSIYVEHFIKSENRWESIKADSIVDDFVYFRTNSFSLFRLVKNVVKAAVYVDVPALGVTAKFSKNVRDIVDGYSTLSIKLCHSPPSII